MKSFVVYTCVLLALTAATSVVASSADPDDLPDLRTHFAEIKDKLNLKGDIDQYQAVLDNEQAELDMLIKMKQQQVDLLKKIKGVDSHIASLQQMYDSVASMPREDMEKFNKAKEERDKARKAGVADEDLPNLEDSLPDMPSLEELDTLMEQIQNGGPSGMNFEELEKELQKGEIGNMDVEALLREMKEEKDKVEL
eukprot:GFYU01009158.1.p1 GENE.GFYU01009158.1~~GFYU01009158.1.p1  ORF type:complete len:196 (-),score=68.28 GFYU01009158.1:240-827(-)